jgi:hypothetical protein
MVHSSDLYFFSLRESPSKDDLQSEVLVPENHGRGGQGSGRLARTVGPRVGGV